MKAILVDPFTSTISQIEIGRGIDEIYRAIQCEMFTIVAVNEANSMFLDDEGFFVPKADQEYWQWAGSNQPYAGRGLILGTDEEGESVSASISLDEVRRKVSFLDKSNIDPEAYCEAQFFAMEGGQWIKL